MLPLTDTFRGYDGAYSSGMKRKLNIHSCSIQILQKIFYQMNQTKQIPGFQ